MGFFDGLIPSGRDDASATGPYQYLRPADPGALVDGSPSRYFLPTLLPDPRELGAGPFVRVMLACVEVWPELVRFRVRIHSRRISPAERRYRSVLFRTPGSGDLRFGLSLGDGRRVTTLDGRPWPETARRRLALEQVGQGIDDFTGEVSLTLTGLPPEGPLSLVVEWPDEGVSETGTALDAAAIRDAALRVVEVWPGLADLHVPDDEDFPPAVVHFHPSGPVAVSARRIGAIRPPTPSERDIADSMASRGADSDADTGISRAPAPPPRPAPRPAPAVRPPATPASVPGPIPFSPPSPSVPARPPQASRRYAPVTDWSGLRGDDWSDLRLVRTRLDAGADPHAPELLHAATEYGSPEVVTLIAAVAGDLEAVNEFRQTALWLAVCTGRGDNAAALLSAGADGWRPVIGAWSAGHLARITPLAPLFANLPGAIALTDTERAVQEDADARRAALGDLYTECQGFAFVAGLDEEEVIRRLGSDPAAHPAVDPYREPGRFGTGPGGFDPNDPGRRGRWLGVTAVEGGCAITQPAGSLPAVGDLLLPLSRGTASGEIYFNISGDDRFTIAHDGRRVADGEITSLPYPDTPEDLWPFRAWQRGLPGAHFASGLAYLSARVGVRVPDADTITGPPHRWIPVPPNN